MPVYLENELCGKRKIPCKLIIIGSFCDIISGNENGHGIEPKTVQFRFHARLHAQGRCVEVQVAFHGFNRISLSIGFRSYMLPRFEVFLVFETAIVTFNKTVPFEGGFLGRDSRSVVATWKTCCRVNRSIVVMLVIKYHKNFWE